MLDLEGLRVRAALFHSIRRFFHSREFLEVDTPVRQPVLIPEANIVPICAGTSFLQTSPEQCMKRLLARGCSKIFQICPCFRADERGRRHLEEFTMLEWYRTGSDYNDLMDDCRALLEYVIGDLTSDRLFRSVIECSCLGSMDFTQKWQRLSVEDAFTIYCPVSLQEAMEEKLFDEMLVQHIEPELGNVSPLFLLDYPAEYGSLARKKCDFPHVAERFELYIKGLELANGFSELTDSNEQRQRFEEEIQKIDEQSGRPVTMPEKFLDELNVIETAAGIAFGLDRLLMLIMSAESIHDTVSFSPEDW